MDALHGRHVHPAVVVFLEAGGAFLPVGKLLLLAGTANEET
jgi:hypothetical protein